MTLVSWIARHFLLFFCPDSFSNELFALKSSIHTFYFLVPMTISSPVSCLHTNSFSLFVCCVAKHGRCVHSNSYFSTVEPWTREQSDNWEKHEWETRRNRDLFTQAKTQTKTWTYGSRLERVSLSRLCKCISSWYWTVGVKQENREYGRDEVRRKQGYPQNEENKIGKYEREKEELYCLGSSG